MNNNSVIYLDNAATTPCAPEVVDAMLPFFTQHYANASSVDHPSGAFARRAVEDSRLAIATLFDARPEDVIFTSGSTEANNLVLSVANRILTTGVEHPSILEPFRKRDRLKGATIPIVTDGLLDLQSLRSALSSPKDQTLISVIATNNETGCEQDVTSITNLSNEFQALVHVDATQAVSTREFRFTANGISALSLSAHKIHGPKGVGALIANSAVRRLLIPTFKGGGQERNLRPGTLNVPGIVGFGAAARLLSGRISQNRRHFADLRKFFLDTLNHQLERKPVETINCELASPHILSLRFPGINSRALLGAVGSQLAFSLGAACATNKSEPSHVLLALGLSKTQIAETMRISFSRYQEHSEIERAAFILSKAVSSLSGLAVHH